MLDVKTSRYSEPVNVHYVNAASIDGRLAISSPLNSRRCEKKRPVLFFHGATVPTQFTSEYRMEGTSWMGELDRCGWCAFGLDLPGYGRSSRYPRPNVPEPDPRTFGSAESVQRDIDAAVNWILNETGADGVHVIAISRGAIPAGYYAAARPETVRSLTLHAPITKKAGIEPEVVAELLGSPEVPRTDTFSLSANDRFRLLSEDRPEGTVSSLEESFTRNWVNHYGMTLATDPGAVALLLARLGVRHVKVCDPDSFELSNINRQPPANVGRNKAVVIGEVIQETTPDVTVEVFPEGMQKHVAKEFVDGCDLIIDCIDFYNVDERYDLHRGFREDANYCRALCWTGTGHYALKPHDDVAQVRYAGDDFEIVPAAEREVVAVNFYPSMPRHGGDLRIWNFKPTVQERRQAGLEKTGYPYCEAMLLDKEYWDLGVSAGDLVLINGGYVHGVTRQSDEGRRLLLHAFIGFVDDNTAVWWT